MRNSYIIEIGEDAVGVVVKEQDLYHFVAATRDVWMLDGNSYKSPADARLAAIAVMNARRQGRLGELQAQVA